MTDPILGAVAAALATKAVTGLYDFVKNAFARRGRTAKQDTAALEAARGAAADSPQVEALATVLTRAAAEDPEFAEGLRVQWQLVAQQVSQDAETGGVTNSISGTVTGNVVQARDIDGGIHFGS
ncbi:MAG TPA: hypothetical protein VF444_13080 [Pseudonocardiaceae bacterium]